MSYFLAGIVVLVAMDAIAPPAGLGSGYGQSTASAHGKQRSNVSAECADNVDWLRTRL
jgi:hypothetical protein